MRITGLELSGFRGFAQTQRFDLDADAVIVVGANGRGKTSIFDAVLWAVAGRIPRLGEDDKKLVSMYSMSGEARVSLDLRTMDGQACHLVRRFDSQQQYLQLEVDGEVLRGAAAKSRLLEILWPEGLVSSDSDAALATAMTRSVYLEQDLVRQFIEADTDQDRFKTVSELVGAGMVTGLSLQLERARTAWTAATNTRAREGQATRQRLANIEAQLLRLSQVSDAESANVEEVWAEWWARAEEMGVSNRRIPGPDSIEAASALDAAVKELAAVRHANDRRRDLAIDLLSDVGARAVAELTDETLLRKEWEAAQRDVELARRALADAENRAARERRAQVELREAREELRALARLALRHLGDRCPVCAQRYDQAETRHRLQELAGAPEGDMGPSSADEVAALAAALEERERILASVEVRLRQAEQSARELRVWMAERDRRAAELGVDASLGSDTIKKQLESIAEQLAETTASLVVHQEKGEQLALTLAQAAESARKAELERELMIVRGDVAELDDLLQSREQTGDLANQILEGLREAGSDVVAAQVKRIVPLLQRIYARVDPHPAFRAVRLLTRISRGRGRMVTEIDDRLADLSTESPEAVLSSSQMNALAVAVFLALNLGVTTPLRLAMMDDPLQTLDDVNLLGLIDLLRRTKDRRQLLVSTHDARFGSLLELKLRPVANGQRTRLIELEEWTREGPRVAQRDVPRDRVPLRIAV
jgi:DNA repair exonuclease SbcCD ATPase subunit